MCSLSGFFAVPSKKDSELKIALERLKILMLFGNDRGKHSAGIVGKSIIKDTVDAIELFETRNIENEVSNIMLGHNRQASYSNNAKDKKQAHPHRVGDITLIHNGTITNCTELRDEYKIKYEDADMDSILLATIINKNKSYDIFRKYEGTATVMWMSDTAPGHLYIHRDNERPLYYGELDGVTYFASIEKALKVIGVKQVKEFKENKIYNYTPDGDVIISKCKKKVVQKVIHCYNHDNRYLSADYYTMDAKIKRGEYDGLPETRENSHHKYTSWSDKKIFVRDDIYERCFRQSTATKVFIYKGEAYFKGELYTGKTEDGRNHYIAGKSVTKEEYETAKNINNESKDNVKDNSLIPLKYTMAGDIPRLQEDGRYKRNGHYYDGVWYSSKSKIKDPLTDEETLTEDYKTPAECAIAKELDGNYFFNGTRLGGGSIAKASYDNLVKCRELKGKNEDWNKRISEEIEKNKKNLENQKIFTDSRGESFKIIEKLETNNQENEEYVRVQSNAEKEFIGQLANLIYQFGIMKDNFSDLTTLLGIRMKNFAELNYELCQKFMENQFYEMKLADGQKVEDVYNVSI